VRRLILSASAWGRNPDKDAIYLTVTPSMNDGAAIYKLNVKDVPVDAFWSVIVYTADGHLQKNQYDAYSLNSITAKKSDDGSVAIQFGGCDSKIANCLPIMPGWNYMVRLSTVRVPRFSMAVGNSQRLSRCREVVTAQFNHERKLVMKTRLTRFTLSSSLALVCAFAASPVMAQKYKTDIPPAITAPESMETRIGILKFDDGFPDDATVQKVYDNLDFQRGVQAFLNTMPAASLSAMREGLRSIGVNNSSVAVFESLMDSKSLFLTANTESVYLVGWLDLKDGPMVIESPPNVLGFVDDFWFHFVTDMGNAGRDQGKGGKYLILPPDYKGEEPAGYLVSRSATYGGELQAAHAPLSAGTGGQPTHDDIHQRQRQGLQHDSRHGLLFLRGGQQGYPGGAECGNRS
jgi:hypothetical protein